jgi:hypothetical protein
MQNTQRKAMIGNPGEIVDCVVMTAFQTMLSQ